MLISRGYHSTMRTSSRPDDTIVLCSIIDLGGGGGGVDHFVFLPPAAPYLIIFHHI